MIGQIIWAGPTPARDPTYDHVSYLLLVDFKSSQLPVAMEIQTATAETVKPADSLSLEDRLKNAEEELAKKCAEIVVLQQALQNLTKRVVDLESRSTAAASQVFNIEFHFAL